MVSKRQAITARSSTEVEIYDTDECVKKLIHILYVLEDLNVSNLLASIPIEIYHDNEVSVKRRKNKTKKRLRYLQMR